MAKAHRNLNHLGCRWVLQYALYPSIFLALLVYFGTSYTYANPNSNLSPLAQKMKQETQSAAQTKINPLLELYCKDSCKLIDIQIHLEEIFGETDELGFEALTQDSMLQSFTVSKIAVTIQVDDRISLANREHLSQILKNNLKNLGAMVEISWQPVTIPQIGAMGAHEDTLLRQLEQKLEVTLQKVIDQYCPDQCLLGQVSAKGHSITPDESLKLKPEEILKDRLTNGVLQVDGIKVRISMDARLEATVRKKIENMMAARTKFVSPVDFDFHVTEFPESYADIMEKKKAESSDPFGLEKLRQTLTIFRELAGTKELITKSSERSDSQEKSSAQASLENSGKWGVVEYGALAIGVVVLGLLSFLGLKIGAAQKEARLMLQHIPNQGDGKPKGAEADAKNQEGLSAEARHEISLRLQCEKMRQELIQLFFESPRVARETFSRLLQDEGVETTAKYVHIFGQMIIFELITDPSLQRDLHDLAEFYHQSNFAFSNEELHKLLNSLKVRATANEMRVLTLKQTDKFDFLRSLDANQVYSLIVEEKPQVQSIVLTQLDPKRRRSVFELYTGQRKLDLMKELSRAETIPIEYLTNVAKALQKKVSNRPEFDTANLKSSDLLFDLLERASIEEQKDLMSGLTESNPEAARAIKIKLVTVEMLPYLKDGHLLEIILGIERDELLQFLAGTREHIRNLIISKAPDELADGWTEDLAQVGRLDEQALRLVELKILNRIRQLAANGFINLLDINELIFGNASSQKSRGEKEPQIIVNKTAMVA